MFLHDPRKVGECANRTDLERRPYLPPQLVLLCQITDPALLVKLLPAAGGVGCALAFAVADFHLTDDLLQGSIPPG